MGNVTQKTSGIYGGSFGMTFPHRYKSWLIWTLLAALTVAGGSFSVCAAAAGGARAGELTETKTVDLPAGEEVIGELQRIINQEEGTMNLNWLERAIRWILKQLKKLKLLRGAEPQNVHIPWDKLMRWLAIPLIILVIACTFYMVGKRFRRDLREDARHQQTVKVTWRSLFQQALAYYPTDPRQAVHTLVKAIICRWVLEGKLKDDPALTLREIETKLSRQLEGGEVRAFSSLRHRYELVYYGNQQLTRENWEEILHLAGTFLREVRQAG